MQNEEKIILSSIEVTAYWWVNVIKSKIREISNSGTKDSGEIKFFNIFSKYSEVEWRNLYLKLINYISLDLENMETFSQDTEKGGHNVINDNLSKIIKRKIPDIRLSSNDTKDLVIYTNRTNTSVWYKSSGVINLPNKYEPSYVLTGDKEKLDFYNLLIATIMLLKQKDSSFKSVSFLREGFCEGYLKRLNFQGSVEDLKNMFNQSFNKASDNDLIMGSAYKEIYFSSFCVIDYNGLGSYFELGDYFSEIVLHKFRENEECVKKIKRK